MRKTIKFLSLILAMVMTFSLFGCDITNNDDDIEKNENDGKDDTTGSTDGGDVTPPSTMPEYFCYSITTESRTYNYGEEIEVSICLQFTRSAWCPEVLDSDGTYVISLVESSGFEIIGESSATFEDVVFEEYLCNTCHNKENKTMSTKFKIKVNEAASITQALNIIVSNTDKGSSVLLHPMYFVADSQGIIIESIPNSFNHNGILDCPPYSLEVEDLYWNFFNTIIEKLLVESYNREYQAGVNVDELIDRYVENMIHDRTYLYLENINGTFTYISKNIRFKVHMPSSHELIGEYKRYSVGGLKQEKEVAKKFLLYAKENGVITEQEYNVEIDRISKDGSDYEVKLGAMTKLFVSGVDFEVPSGDDYYNYVVDLRN